MVNLHILFSDENTPIIPETLRIMCRKSTFN